MRVRKNVVNGALFPAASLGFVSVWQGVPDIYSNLTPYYAGDGAIPVIAPMPPLPPPQVSVPSPEPFTPAVAPSTGEKVTTGPVSRTPPISGTAPVQSAAPPLAPAYPTPGVNMPLPPGVVQEGTNASGPDFSTWGEQQPAQPSQGNGGLWLLAALAAASFMG